MSEHDEIDADEDEEDEKTYKIVRLRFGDDARETIDTGCTLEYVQEWCNRDDTHGDGWFDAYYEE